MLASELPPTATVVSAGIWTDPASRCRYYLDPTDPLLLLSRAWTVAETTDYNASVLTLGQNSDTLKAALLASITTLTTDIGLLQTNPNLVIDSSSLNGIIKSTAAQINADPSVYIKALARYMKHTMKAVVADAKIDLGLVSDTNTGA